MPIKKYSEEMGARGRKRRLELELNTKEVAQVLGITTTRLNQMETDGCQNVDTVRAWADALDMDAATLMFGQEKGTSRVGPGSLTKRSPRSKRTG